jgi:hypothetical protein
VFVIVLTGSIGLAACGSAITTRTSLARRATSPPSGHSESTAQLLSAVTQNARQAGWVEINIQQVGPGGTAFYQDLSINGANTESEIVDNVAYFKADASVLTEVLGVPASKAERIANQWVAFSRADSRYATIADGLTMSSVLGKFLPAAPLTQVASSAFEGVPQVIIKGSAPLTFDAKTASLLVTVGSHPLPVLLSEGQGTESSLQVGFLRWGVPVRSTVPAGAVPAASVGL